jgi:hypothetical protein
MLDEKVCLSGMFTICLNTCIEDGKYFFETQNDGHGVTKSPEGMFEALRIPNDLELVRQAIINYNKTPNKGATE